MKPRRVRFELSPVPCGYEPGYPAGLTAGEYRELLLPGTRERLHGLAAAMLLVGGGAGAAAAQQPVGARSGRVLASGGTREERVLALVRGLGLESSGWFPRSTFLRAPDKGPHTILPRIPISFGNSYSGVFDAAGARRLALEAFRAYGLDPRTDAPMSRPGVQGVLDGLDNERRIGFELSGLSDRETYLGPVVAEPAEMGLDEDELERLAREGYRIHQSSLAWYPVMDGEACIARLAYLAGIVSFLNEVTDGPDVDLSAVLRMRTQRFPLPDVSAQLPDGCQDTREDGRWILLLRERGTLRLPFARPGDAPPLGRAPLWSEQRQAEQLVAPLSTAGCPTLVRLDLYLEGAPQRPQGQSHVRLRLVQEGEGAAPATDVRSQAGMLLVPTGFDAARPFTLEFELEPGRYVLEPFLEVGVPQG